MDRFTGFIEKLKLFAENNDKIECVLIVGSYAKGSFTENSDLDIVIITPLNLNFLHCLLLPDISAPSYNRRRSITEPAHLFASGIRPDWKLNSDLLCRRGLKSRLMPVRREYWRTVISLLQIKRDISKN